MVLHWLCHPRRPRQRSNSPRHIESLRPRLAPGSSFEAETEADAKSKGQTGCRPRR